MPTPVNIWDEIVLVKTETAFGTLEDPVTASGIEVHDLDMGPPSVGVVRPKKDKTAGRDETLEFIEGRVEPIPFSLSTSVKTRATAATAAKEAAILKAAGWIETIGANAAYALSSDPTVLGLSVHASGGRGTSNRFTETGKGGIIKSLDFAFGNQELVMKASGAFVDKEHQGTTPSVTFADGISTDFSTATASHADRIGLGYYLCESEVIKVQSINTTTGAGVALRAQLGTAGVAHAAKPIYPHVPAPTVSGSPITEAKCVVTLDGIATRCRSGSIKMSTGLEHLQGESGSRLVQGAYAKRVGVTAELELVLDDERVDLIGKARRRKSVALSVVCGDTAGGIVTFSLPTCEIGSFPVPRPSNDIAIVRVPLRVRGNTGNDLLAITYS